MKTKLILMMMASVKAGQTVNVTSSTITTQIPTVAPLIATSLYSAITTTPPSAKNAQSYTYEPEKSIGLPCRLDMIPLVILIVYSTVLM
ncbi:hypothetical protein BC833DRAFT_242206 [Globomyces pollinis-pini]|nr:hypothetical protein BC833DRAFT_242206 [Globomyces pollinis-pini]